MNANTQLPRINSSMQGVENRATMQLFERTSRAEEVYAAFYLRMFALSESDAIGFSIDSELNCRIGSNENALFSSQLLLQSCGVQGRPADRSRRIVVCVVGFISQEENGCVDGGIIRKTTIFVMIAHVRRKCWKRFFSSLLVSSSLRTHLHPSHTW
jgi:hypothetical protein